MIRTWHKHYGIYGLAQNSVGQLLVVKKYLDHIVIAMIYNVVASIKMSRLKIVYSVNFLKKLDFQ